MVFDGKPQISMPRPEKCILSCCDPDLLNSKSNLFIFALNRTTVINLAKFLQTSGL